MDNRQRILVIATQAEPFFIFALAKNV